MEQQELADDLVPVVKAAELLGVRRQTLDKKLRVRGLRPVRQVIGGRVLVFLPRAWLKLLEADQPEAEADQLRPQKQLPQPREGQPTLLEADQPEAEADQPEATATLRAEVKHLRAALEAALAEKHALGGKLAGAEYVEQATSRRCDRLEERLEAMQREQLALVQAHGVALAEIAATHARELGRRDTLVATLREKVEAVVADAGPWWLSRRAWKGG